MVRNVEYAIGCSIALLNVMEILQDDDNADESEDFKVDVHDQRFAALLEGDERFGIDRTNKDFKETDVSDIRKLHVMWLTQLCVNRECAISWLNSAEESNTRPKSIVYINSSVILLTTHKPDVDCWKNWVFRFPANSKP